MAQGLVYTGAAVVIFWGVAHAAPLSTVVAGFHLTSTDNRRILTMEWLAEALSLVFVGSLTATVTAAGSGPTIHLVQRAVAGVLFALAVLHALLGARTAIRPMQVCPVVLTLSGGLIVAGSTV